MNMNSILITGAVVAAVGGALYYFYKKGGEIRYFRINESNSETIEGELKMSDIVSYLKLQNLEQDKHMPFMAKWNDLRIQNVVRGDTKEGYEAIFVGAYNDKTDEFDVFRVFFARSLDAQVKEIMGNETLVVLS